MGMNIGTTERIARTFVGAGLVGAAALGVISPLGYLGMLAFVTGLVGYCPVYRILGQHP